jgi:hypothetical protein
MPAVQSHMHAVLIIYLSGAGPVDIIRIQYPATSTGQRVGDAAILVLIICEGKNGAGFQNEYPCILGSGSRNVIRDPGNEAGIGRLRNFRGP